MFENLFLSYILASSIAFTSYHLYVFFRFLVRRFAPQYACKCCVHGIPMISIDGKVFFPRYCPHCGRRL